MTGRTTLKLAALCGAVGLATVPLAAAGGGESSYEDPAGDAASAPDVTAVSLTDDGAGGTVFAITLASMPDLQPDGRVVVLIDTDRNRSTGEDGIELVLVGDATRLGLLRWDGSQYVPSQAERLDPRLEGGVVRFTLTRADLGSDSFDFVVGGARGDDVDSAPDRGLFTYPRAAVIRSVAIPATVFAPKAGKVLSARNVRLVLDIGQVVRPQTMRCRLTHAGRTIAGRPGGCAWLIPKRMRGKAVVLRLDLAYEGATLTHTVRLRVR